MKCVDERARARASLIAACAMTTTTLMKGKKLEFRRLLAQNIAPSLTPPFRRPTISAVDDFRFGWPTGVW
jgi:hypothetical protein